MVSMPDSPAWQGVFDDNVLLGISPEIREFEDFSPDIRMSPFSGIILGNLGWLVGMYKAWGLGVIGQPF